MREDESQCPVCDSATTERETHLSDHNGIRYRLNACATCDLEHWSPRRFDPSIYNDDGFEAYQQYHAGGRPFPRWAEPLFQALPKDAGNALDVGCGDGSVLARLQASGLRVRGTDLDGKSVAVANGKCGEGTCIVSTLDAFAADCRTRGETYDLVTFFEVLEHQVEPGQFLADIRSITSKGGMIAGSVPNRNRFLATLDRRYGDGDLPPHHFLWFSAKSLREALVRSGFADVRVSRVESVRFGELCNKLKALLGRERGKRLGFVHGAFHLAATVFWPVAAAFIHLGRLAMPSHLYFSCRNPDGPK